MLVDFFYILRKAQVPVSIKELLTLLEALENHLAFACWDDFYLLAPVPAWSKTKSISIVLTKPLATTLKAWQNSPPDPFDNLIPEQWLEADFIRNLSEEDKAEIEKLGGLDKLMETLAQRFEEQKERHAGGSKWIGTGGTSPFGHSGYNPEGVRIGGESKHKRAVKVWEKRQFRDLDDNVELGTRNMKVALRKLRKFARTGAAEELDLDDTIRSTANNAGLLDLKMVPERHNAAKVLLFFLM